MKKSHRIDPPTQPRDRLVVNAVVIVVKSAGDLRGMTMFSKLPVKRSSMMKTRRRARDKRPERCEPIKPAPPVIRTRNTETFSDFRNEESNRHDSLIREKDRYAWPPRLQTRHSEAWHKAPSASANSRSSHTLIHEIVAALAHTCSAIALIR